MINIIKIKSETIAEVNSDDVIIKTVQDAVDLMGNCSYQGAYKIVIKEKNIIPEFFDLKTKIAGEILQKFSTYNMKLEIIGNFSKFTSKSLKDFIYESNKQGRITFIDFKKNSNE
ncbi:MAG: DUF4180 domain-containing protein [Bacteroidales bacterium]|nr:DUF4180 domain-containing protein [Bacteroidales bacterium]